MAGVHEDFGEKIGGAKKDLWKDRGLYADDLEAMNEREAEKFVKKDNVWKKPDYAAMLEEGIPLGVVYFIKKARDGLNASPQYYRTDDTPEKRTARQKEYIKTVRELQTVLSDVRTVEDAVRAYDRFFVDNGYLEKVQGWGRGIHYRATKKGQDNPVITNKLSNTMLIRSAEYFERNFIMSDTDGTFAFLISLIYSILFNRLCERADDVYGGRLPIHVRCLIDEAANIGQIPNLERLMATIRSREISACLVLQAQSQLKALYKDNMDTVIGNCDASLFLGGKEETTLKSWNSLLGKETIDLYNTSITKGNQESHGQNFQKLGKDMPYLFVKSSVALNLS